MNNNLNTPAIAAAIKLRATDLLVREAEDQCSPEVKRAALSMWGCLSGSLTPAESLVLLATMARLFENSHQPLPALDALVAAAAERYRGFTTRSERRTPFGEPGFPLSPKEAQRQENAE